MACSRPKVDVRALEGLRVWPSWNGRSGCPHWSCAKLLKGEGGARGSRRGRAGATAAGGGWVLSCPHLRGRIFTPTWPLAHPDNTVAEAREQAGLQSAAR